VMTVIIVNIMNITTIIVTITIPIIISNIILVAAALPDHNAQAPERCIMHCRPCQRLCIAGA
jgi:hypothetical protein